MNELIYSYFYVSLLSISLVCMVEVLINFNRPINLKFTLFIILLSIFLHSILGILHYNHYDNNVLNFLSRLFQAIAVSILFFILFRVNSNNILLKIFKYLFFSILGLSLILILFKTYFKTLFQHYQIDFSFITLLRSITGFVLLGYMGTTIFIKFGKKLSHTENLYVKKTFKWSICILSIIVCNAIGNLVRYLTGVKGTMFEIDVLIGDYITIFSVLFRPNYLNRAFHNFSFSEMLNSTPHKRLLKDEFIFHFFTNTYYLNTNASIKDFSSIINFSQEELSDFVIKFYNITFSELVNKSRIEYFIDLVKAGKHSQLTIEALGQKAGFGSRQNLYRSYKKFQGGNPSDLLRPIIYSPLKKVI